MHLSVRLFLLIALCSACSDSVRPQDANVIGAAGSGVAVMSPAGAGGMPVSGTQPSMGGRPGGGAGASGSSAAGTAGSSAMVPPTPVGAAGAAAGSSAGASGAGGVMGGAGASAAAGMSAAGAGSDPTKVGHPHRFIASVHGGGADKLVYVDVDDPQQNWKLDVRDGIQDFQLIGKNKLLVGYKFNFGYLEVDLVTHKVDVEVRDFLTREQAILTSVKRLANGHTLIMAQGLQGGAASDLEVWEVDNDKKVHQKRTFKGCCGNLRVVRLTAEGHFLVGGDSALVELDEMGKEVARLTTGGSPTYMGLKTADGTYYATNGHGGQLLAFAPGGGLRRVIGGRSSTSASKVTIYQPGQFQILQNGNIVITNWTAENGGMGQQLVEYAPDGNMVWSWDDPSVRPQGMETLLVLDNLDPSVVNDDRDGVLKPQP